VIIRIVVVHAELKSDGQCVVGGRV